MDRENNPLIASRKDESRILFKKCFKNPIFSFVPFEVWRDLILSNADATFLAQTCWGFKELVDYVGENNFNLALSLRKESQMYLARKYLLLCANNGNLTAMFHAGYAYSEKGWALETDDILAVEWFKKSAELGNGHAIALYANALDCGIGVYNKQNKELSNVWAKKALSSSNSFAIAFCHHYGFGTKRDHGQAFNFFEKAAKQGDEFAQNYLGRFFNANFWGVSADDEKAFYWFLKSAEQGLNSSQREVSYAYSFGSGCVKSDDLCEIWSKKANAQSHGDFGLFD